MQMKLLAVALLCLPAAAGAAGAAGTAGPNEALHEQARWQRRAEHVRIIRDNWGIAHVYGTADADAVFGMIYAQAEGESAVYRDLRERLFVDLRGLRRQYHSAPEWLKTLMIAWSDGLNYYL